MRLRFHDNADAVVRELQALAGRLANPEIVLKDLGEHMVNEAVPDNFSAGGRPRRWPSSPWTSEKVQMDTGNLLRSVRYELLSARLRVGTNLKYANQRQMGGDLKPTNAKALAIPFPGVPRSMRRPRRWGKRLSFIPSRKPDVVGLLGLRTKTGFEPKFVLRKRLKTPQPARPFLLWSDNDMAWFGRRLARYATEGQ